MTQSRFVSGGNAVTIPGDGVKVFASGATSVDTPAAGLRSSAAADVMFVVVSVPVPAKPIIPICLIVPVAIAAWFRSRIASSSQSSVVSELVS